jgi:Cys-tRNA(Pro) deacylase
MTMNTDIPATPAIRQLREKGVAFTAHTYPYQEHGGTAHAAECMGVTEHTVVKTLVMETETHEPLLVLMHGDCEVSTKQLARFMGVKSVTPCDLKTAQRHTGYMFGGTSPFGTRKALPVYIEESILGLESIFINGGRRGLQVRIAPGDIQNVLPFRAVTVAIPQER